MATHPKPDESIAEYLALVAEIVRLGREPEGANRQVQVTFWYSSDGENGGDDVRPAPRPLSRPRPIPGPPPPRPTASWSERCPWVTDSWDAVGGTAAWPPRLLTPR